MVGLGITPKEASKKHRLEPLYEVSVYDIEDRTRFCYSGYATDMVYLSKENAMKVAIEVAQNIAWFEQLRALDNPDYNTEKQTFIVCVATGRRYSKKGNLFGFKKLIYAISSQTKEVTERFTMDKRFKDLQIDEYTEKPILTKDMFYQWPE